MTGTIANRSVPTATLIPTLAYRDVLEAADWLCAVFGFHLCFASRSTGSARVRRRFSQSIADVDPADWGGTLVDMR